MDGNDTFKDDGVIAPHSDDGTTEELMVLLLSSNDNVQEPLVVAVSWRKIWIKRNRIGGIFFNLNVDSCLSFCCFPISTLPLIRLE